MPSQQGRAVTPYLLGTLSLLNWTRNGLHLWLAAIMLFSTSCCILSNQSRSPHILPLWFLYLCKSKGTSWSCSWSQTLMWRSWVSRLLCTLLIIRIGIFWRRSSEGTWAWFWVVLCFTFACHDGHFSSPLPRFVGVGWVVSCCFP